MHLSSATLTWTALLLLSFVSITVASPLNARAGASRTSPPSGCKVVRSSNLQAGEFSSLSAAIASLGSSQSSACIFLYQGTYNGQTTVQYGGPLTIYGYTTDITNYAVNTVTLSHGIDSTDAGTLDKSSTVQVLGSNVKFYNINIENTYGKVGTYSQAVALTANGNDISLYGCKITSYQDTLYAKTGNLYIKRSYIEGAVDYIFGGANLWISQSILASNGPGYITASGRSTNDGTRYVIDSSSIEAAAGYTTGTSKTYLGRPWRVDARVMFQNSKLSEIINPQGWYPMAAGATPDYEEVNNSGAGSNTAQRKYETKASGAFAIGQVFSGNYCQWIDCSY